VSWWSPPDRLQAEASLGRRAAAVDTYVLGKTDFDTALASSQSFRDQLYRTYFMRH
jgi:hypothetical protein